MHSHLGADFDSEAALEAALAGHLAAYPYRVQPAEDGISLLLPQRDPLPWHRPLSRRRFWKRRRPGYEPVATALFDFVLERMPGGTVYDLGAEIGYFSHLAAARRDLAPRVHAFEMRPDNIARLEARSRALGLQVHAHLAGMSDRDRGTRRIWYSITKMFEQEPLPAAYRDSLATRLKFRLKGREGRDRLHQAEVHVDSIDAFAARTGTRPGLIKIDIDGSEAKAVPGGLGTFRGARPVILLELHKRRFLAPHGASRAEVLGPLFEIGYAVLLMTAPGDLRRNRIRRLTPGDPRITRDRTDLLFCV